MDNEQYYPTPFTLAQKAWDMFDRGIMNEFGSAARVLEPSAGEGHLIEAMPSRLKHCRPTVDAIEIDLGRHPAIKDKNANVVGIDFEHFDNGAMYTHIIMNPPFSKGAAHVLKAWDILWHGEIVAILNAETIRNPFSAERRHLVRLIEAHGRVEYIEKAFATGEAERKALVDVALVYLHKQSDLKQDIVGSILDDLVRDNETEQSVETEQLHCEDQLAVSRSTIENAVLAFNAAVEAERQAVFAKARARYYTRLLGETMAEISGTGGTNTRAGESSAFWVRKTFGERYDDLKDRAWTKILRSTQVTDRLSSKGQKAVESQFNEIKTLDFTTANIYGFLLGLSEKQGQIQIEMACDVFDQFTRYHTDNAVFYRGWKSNDRHRTCGMRLKMTRFILPGHGTYSWSGSLLHESERLLSDFDKVFAMLDGKRQPEVSLVEIFRKYFDELRSGERVSASYFDIRYYPGAGTIHFFPTNKELVDRLNRLVGRHREWLPPEEERVSDDFWLQYEKAEAFDRRVRSQVEKDHCANGSFWRSPLQRAGGAESEEALSQIAGSLDTVLRDEGIDPDTLLEPPKLRLTAA